MEGEKAQMLTDGKAAQLTSRGPEAVVLSDPQPPGFFFGRPHLAREYGHSRDLEGGHTAPSQQEARALHMPPPGNASNND